MGSAVAQNKIPTAIVVVRVMAIQFQGDNKGSAFLPPILIRPSGEKAAQIQVRRKENAAQANRLEKMAKIPSFKVVVIVRNDWGLIKLTTTIKINTANGIQKTKGRRAAFLSAGAEVVRSEEIPIAFWFIEAFMTCLSY